MKEITFGNYNGTQLTWLVLAEENDKCLLITKDCITEKAYNDNNGAVTWETCTLRTWLNDEFLNSTFSSVEQARIQTTTVSADKNTEYSTNPGNATNDKVFLLSKTEANEYFSSNSARIAKYNGNSCWWWLRSPGGYQLLAAIADDDGDVVDYGLYVHYGFIGVRPALWVNL